MRSSNNKKRSLNDSSNDSSFPVAKRAKFFTPHSMMKNKNLVTLLLSYLVSDPSTVYFILRERSYETPNTQEDLTLLLNSMSTLFESVSGNDLKDTSKLTGDCIHFDEATRNVCLSSFTDIDLKFFVLQITSNYFGVGGYNVDYLKYICCLDVENEYCNEIESSLKEVADSQKEAYGSLNLKLPSQEAVLGMFAVASFGINLTNASVHNYDTLDSKMYGFFKSFQDGDDAKLIFGVSDYNVINKDDNSISLPEMSY